MKARSFAIALTLLMFANCGSLMLACGDKFLVPNRGSRVGRPAVAREPAAVLIYESDPELRRALANTPVADTLRKVGYRPTTVTEGNAFQQEIARGAWDVVMVGIGEAQTVTNLLRGALSPIVVPVALNPTAAQFKQARKTYPFAFKATGKGQSFLEAVDEALAHRAKSPKGL